jgi:TolB-like protein/thioredoxin-like negative regulator of GroEL
MSLISELKRRNVLRVGAAYVVTAWLIIQVVETIFPVYGLSDAAIRLVITGLAVGLIPALILAWVFELTPEGLRRDSEAPENGPASRSTARNLDRAIMVVLAIGIAYFAVDKFMISPAREAAIAEAAREAGRSEASLQTYGERSIAVLAFADMSPDRDQAYMSDGIAEEILNLLARVPDLRVISRTSAFAFKDSELPIPEIARQLNAAFILEGSVRKAGDQLRITAQLIEAGVDAHRWSQTYDRRLENVFDIQDEIAAHVVDALKSTLLGNAPKSQRLDEEAYTLALQARYLWNRRGAGDEQEALKLYQQAVRIDPGYAPAWTGLSVAYAVAALKERMDPSEGLRLAREAVDRALALDPNSAEARVRLGQALGREGDTAGMLEQFRRAFAAEPNNPLALGIMAQQAGRQGEIEEVVRLYDRAAAVDPLSAIWHTNKAYALTQHRRADAAQEALERAYELNGDLVAYRTGMVDIHNIRGEYTPALALLQDLPAKEQNLTRKAIALYGVGRVEEADTLLETIRSVPVPEARLAVAMIYANRGNSDLAFEQLAKVDGISPWNMVYDAYLRVLVDDPRWKPWVDSLDWPWEYAY